MAHSIEHQMTEIYCFVDDYLRAHPRSARWRRSPHHSPRFSDAGVITIALLQGALGCATLKRTHALVEANWRRAFPRLPSYAEGDRRRQYVLSRVRQAIETGFSQLCEQQFLDRVRALVERAAADHQAQGVVLQFVSRRHRLGLISTHDSGYIYLRYEEWLPYDKEVGRSVIGHWRIPDTS